MHKLRRIRYRMYKVAGPTYAALESLIIFYAHHQRENGLLGFLPPTLLPDPPPVVIPRVYTQ